MILELILIGIGIVDRKMMSDEDRSQTTPKNEKSEMKKEMK